MNGVQLDDAAKAEVFAKYEEQLKGKELSFDVKRVGISTGLFVPSMFGGVAEDWATALEHADEAQDAAKAHGKDQLRVYYSQFVRKMKRKGIAQSEWISSSEILKPFTASDGKTQIGCLDYTGSRTVMSSNGTTAVFGPYVTKHSDATASSKTKKKGSALFRKYKDLKVKKEYNNNIMEF